MTLRHSNETLIDTCDDWAMYYFDRVRLAAAAADYNDAADDDDAAYRTAVAVALSVSLLTTQTRASNSNRQVAPQQTGKSVCCAWTQDLDD